MPRHRTRATLLLLFATAQLAIAPSVLASPSASNGFPGTWASVDCAQWWEDGHVDCDVWGDGSAQFLSIGKGDEPRVSFQDSFATVCANTGSGSTRWVAVGTGQYDDIFLWLTFDKSGCGSFGQGGYGGIQLYHDPGSDTLWEDEDGDGWGTVWYRLT